MPVRAALGAAAFLAAVYVCFASAQSAPTEVGDESACSAAGLHVEIYREFQKASTETKLAPCRMHLGNASPPPRDMPPTKSDVTVSIDDTGLHVSFTMNQPSVVETGDFAKSDAMAVTFYRPPDANRYYFTVVVDASLNCTSVSRIPAMALTHDQCAVKPKHYWSPKEQWWAGTVTISIPKLDANIPNGISKLKVWRYVRLPSTFWPMSDTATITIDRSVRLRHYLSFGPHIGTYNVGGRNEIPPHRWVLNGWAQLFPNVYSALAFADDAGKVLSIRNTAVKSIIHTDTSKAYKCHACGSFQTDYTEVFDSPITSTSALGLDLSKVGLDTLPFTFDAVSYPIDAGYKVYGSSGWGNIGVASLHGTTAKNGFAEDFVAHSFAGATFKSGAKMYLGLFDVIANRSEVPATNPSTFPSNVNTLLHSANTLLSAGFISPGSSDPQSNSLVFNGLLRYGSQAAPNSQTTDVAFSLLRSPPYLNSFSSLLSHIQGTIAAGYRSVGQLYNPIDGSYDIHTGEKGFYGRGDLLFPFRGRSIDLALSGYRFFDSVETRDEAVNGSLKYKMSSASTAQFTYQAGTLAILTAARANNIIVTDAQGGAGILPNNAHAFNFDTKPTGTLSLSLGYDWHQQQTCNTKITTAPPCFASNNSGVTGGAHWEPFSKSDAFKDFFVEYSRSGSETNLFPATFDVRSLVAQKAGLSTTANRIVETEAVGMHIFKNANGCSTLLLTQANRGGDVDNFAKSAPQPGNTKTASLEIAPGDPWPAFLVAYSRVRNDATTTPLQTLFLVRVQFGLSPKTYADAVKANCNA